jgi:hypothetical protein
MLAHAAQASQTCWPFCPRGLNAFAFNLALSGPGGSLASDFATN